MTVGDRASSRSLWEANLSPDLRRLRPRLQGDTDVDACIVGGGLTGLWTAYHLLSLDPFRRVLVVEAGRVGFGASGCNGGWCSGMFPVSTAALVQRHGHSAAIEMRKASIGTVVLARGTRSPRLAGGVSTGSSCSTPTARPSTC